MPQFAANLSMMFTARPFLERFAAAAAAGSAWRRSARAAARATP